MVKKLLFILLLFTIQKNSFCQSNITKNNDDLLVSTTNNTCNCIDSINIYDNSPKDVSQKVSDCINQNVVSYQVGLKLLNIDSLAKNANQTNGNKEIKVDVYVDENSQEYKDIYYTLERYLLTNCKSLQTKMAANEKLSDKSASQNSEAIDAYNKGIKELEKENIKKAIEYFENAVKIDANFAFAWDNIGVCSRKLGDYDKALIAYKKSLEIDPKGILPLQNIAVVYQYKKEFDKAIDAYNKMAEIEPNNPETFYGIGQLYVDKLQEYEKGLGYMCKAYNLYIKQKSPYRADAENVIQVIYAQMKKDGKETKFNEILKENNISIK